MSEEEKQNIVSLICTQVVSVPYIIYILMKRDGQTLTSEEELKFWATSILLVIPIRIVAQILVFIIFTIFRAIINGGKEEESIEKDERDKLIELKGGRIASDTFMFGFFVALIAIVAGSSITIFFEIIFVSAFVGEIISTLLKVYYYRRGF